MKSHRLLRPDDKPFPRIEAEMKREDRRAMVYIMSVTLLLAAFGIWIA